MRIERGHHAVDGAFDQAGVVGLLDIVGADALENLAEQIELGIGVAGVRGGFRPGDDIFARPRDQQRQAHTRHRTQEK